MIVRSHTFAVCAALTAAGFACKKSEDKQSPQAKDEGGTDVSTDTGNPDDGDFNVTVTAAGTLALANQSLALSVLTPDTSPGEYPGMGINYSYTIVDGLKITLTGITFGTGIYGRSEMTQVTVFNWASAPKPLEIRDGFDGEITDEAKVEVGAYDWLQISCENAYELKAYAYFDGDNDGNVDSTIYTTAGGIVADPTKLDMTTVTTYDYLLYEPEQSPCGLTVPSKPVEVASGKHLFVSVNIDTSYIVRAWDGRWGTASVPITGDGIGGGLPGPDFPFNTAQVDFDDTAPSKPFRPGVPAFALLGIPMYVTASEAEGDVTAHTYVISDTSGLYTPFNTSVFTVIFDAAGHPVIGQIAGGDSSGHLHIGPPAKHFESEDGTAWSFYAGSASGGGNHPDDGGFFYKSDIERAAHRVTNFVKLDTVGATGTMTLGNAARCDGEYNYCVPDGSDVATPDNGATKTLYIQRIR